MRNRKPFVYAGAAAALAVTLTFAAPAAFGSTNDAGQDSAAYHGERDSYEIGLFGDMPYGDYGRAQYPATLADINDHHLAFSIFDGDAKNGSEPCWADPHPQDPSNPTPERAVADAAHPDVYRYALDKFATLRDPLIFLPGDNEWTDCDRTTIQGGHVSDSSDRLAYERSLFYTDDRSLGQHKIPLTRQSAEYPENVRWSKGPVTYLGLNIPGSDNNFADGGKNGPAAEGQAEYAARNAANLRWLREGFAAAKAEHSRAVMIVIQADMWDPSAVVTHYADTKRELFTQTTGFDGEVLLVNGDSHSFELDKPLTDYATTNAAGLAGPNVVQNFTRVTTFGESQNHWLSVTVDPKGSDLFSFHQQHVTANLPRYTPPA